MGMTIENCINELLINKEDDTYVLGNETIDFAIATMHKYQKIQEIIDDYEGEGWERIAISDIREVIEDGKID